MKRRAATPPIDSPAAARPPPASFNTRLAWAGLWLLRALLAVFIVQGADVPDEWWQSTEVAEFVVFGRGALTWEWTEGLRSYTYPLPFICAFRLMKLLGLDSPTLIWLVPRLMAATVCFGVDRVTAAIARSRIYPSERALPLALLLSCTSWFVAYVGVRTQSNVAEALALLWALHVGSFSGFLMWCGLGCALRVTFAVPAAVMFVHRLQDRCFSAGDDRDGGEGATGDRSKCGASTGTGAVLAMVAADRLPASVRDGIHAVDESTALDEALWLMPRRRGESSVSAAARHLAGTAVTAAATLAAIAAVDRAFYGRWLCAPLNFLTFNVVSGLSEIFGTHPLHWYVTSALPVMWLTLTPMVALGIQSVLSAQPPAAYLQRPECGDNARRSRTFVVRLLQIIGFSTAVLSVLGHKEMRFLFFCVPLAALVAAACWASDATLWRKRRMWTVVHVAVNSVVLLFFGLAWQRGPISVADYVRGRACDATQSLHALTHCFALPGESFFHGCVSEFVHNTCPVVRLAKPQQQQHQGAHAAALDKSRPDWKYALVEPTASDMFLESPLEFVEYVYEGKAPHSTQFRLRTDMCCGGAATRRLPTRFVLYDVHEQELAEFLQRNQYARRRSFFHTFVPLESFHGKSMVLYERVA